MIVKFEKVNEGAWNSALKEAGPRGTIFQSTFWAQYLTKTFGDSPIYVASLDKKGNIRGLLLSVESCFGKHPSLTLVGKKGALVSKLYKYSGSPFLKRMAPFVSWENGPVIALQSLPETDPEKESVYREILENVVAIAVQRNCYEIKFARPAFFDDRYKMLFNSLGFAGRRMGTLLVNLDRPLEVLWQHVDNDARRCVKRAIQQGIDISEASKPDELREFYDLTVQTAGRSEQKIYPFSYFESLWNHFSPLNKIVVFIARTNIEGEPIATSLSLMHNETVHIFAIGDSDRTRTSKIFANEALMWHTIKWAHERGFKYFDHSGVQLHKIDSGDQKALNIFRFKAKWGGQLIEYHDYQKTLRRRKLVKLLSHFMVDSMVHN